MNLLAALVLFLCTAYFLYVMYRMLHKKKKKPTKTPAIKETPEEKKKPSGGKDSYCYPTINDVMGYEFVKVVNVEPQLAIRTDDKPSVKENGNDKSKDVAASAWKEGKTAGGIRTVSVNQTRQDTEEDNPYPDSKRPVNPVTPKQNDNEEDAAESVDITENELNIAESFPGWGEHNDDNIPDELLNSMLDGHEDMIETPRFDDEQKKTEQQINDIKERFYNLENLDNEKNIDYLMNDDANPVEGEGKPGEDTDFNEGEYQDVDYDNNKDMIEPDDIPEID